MLADAFGKASNKIDAFATWLLAGFAAAVALLLSHHDAMTLVPGAVVRLEVELFLWMAIVTVIQKYLAIIVAGGSEAAVVGRQMVLEHMETLESPSDFNAAAYGAESLRSVPPFARPYIRRMLAAVMSGDVGIYSRRLAKLAQMQAIFLLIEAILFLTAILQLGRAVPT